MVSDETGERRRRTAGTGMKIRKVETDKKEYLPLLLLADEQEDMIDRYLDRGELYVLEDNGVKAVCVVTDEGNGILEIKNLAVSPEFQGRGYGRRMIRFVTDSYRDRFDVLYVGTGDSPATVPFYEKCGFCRSHVVRNFFTEHYDHPIYECGRQLIDMVYLKMELREAEMKIERIDHDFSVCKVKDYSQTDMESEYCFIGKTDEECSLVCITDDMPGNVTDHNDGWKAFRIKGTLDFSLIGILAKLSALMAENGIGIFAVSTYNTDYILTKKENFEKAMEVLEIAGYEIF